MITVTVGNSYGRTDVQVNETTATPESLLKKHAPDYIKATNYLNGEIISNSDLTKTFAELGITDDTSLIAIIKLDNA